VTSDKLVKVNEFSGQQGIVSEREGLHLQYPVVLIYIYAKILNAIYYH